MQSHPIRREPRRDYIRLASLTLASKNVKSYLETISSSNFKYIPEADLRTSMSQNSQYIDNIILSLSRPSPQPTAEQEAVLLEPFTYLASSPGKGSCIHFIQAFNLWLKVPPAQLKSIIRVTELLHDASLLVDDIEDDSELRRGKLVAHKVYGVAQTINSANYVYFLAYQEVLKISYLDQVENPSNSGLRLIQILNDEMLALHRGQGRELLWRDHLNCPTEEEYIQMVKDKTAGALRIAVKLMVECATANANTNYVPLVDLLGIWYQIRDDYMNLRSNAYTERKGFAEDLSEGKFSFPIIHGMKEKPDSKYLINVIRQRSKSQTLKHNVLTYLEEVTHSLEYTLRVLNSLEAQARTEVMRLGGNAGLEAIFERLAMRDGY